MFTNLIPGEYRVEEIAPPQFYMGTTTVHTVNILDGNTETVTVEFRNEPWTGLMIRKVDKTNAKGLPGAIFKLYKGSEEDPKAYLGDWESGENGSVTIQKLEPGYYTIVESQAPYGYLLDQEHHVQTIEIKPEAVDRNITVVFQNLPKPKLLIEKIDKVTGLRLPGAVFHVSRRGSEEYMEVRTGSDGTVLLENLEDDWYTVTEVRSPSGYVLDSRHYDVEMIPGKTVPLIINNLQQPDLLLRKVDEQTGSGVPGAVLRITKDGAKEYKDVTTGADGTYLVKDLEPGWYIVEEIKAPDGYLLNDEPQYIELIAGQGSELIIKNRHKPSLEILKIDSVTKQPLEGVSFRVQIKNGKTLGEYRTDAAGRIYLENIDPELYVVTEVKAPDGYILLTGSKEALVEWGKTTTLQFENQPRNPILVKKVDTKTGEPLAGAKFRVEKSNGERMGDFVTNSAGFFVAPDLEAGTYTVYETAAPAGYILDKTPQTAVLRPNGTTTLEFSNKPLAGLQIKKVDAVTGLPMKGVEFKITKLNSEPVGIYVTDDAGLIFVPDMKEGWYVVTETRTLDGYKLDNALRNVEVASDKLNLVEYRNQPYPHLQLVKIDAETKAPIEGVRFKVSDRLGRELGTFSTNKLGQIHLTGMEQGTYYVQEVEAKPGYVLDSTVQEVSLLWGKTTKLEIPNTPLGTLRIKKIDSETKQPLFGAVFNLYDLKGNLLGEYTTDNRGIIEFPKEVQAGKYKLKEVKAPAGYVLDEMPKTIEVKAGETLELEILNKPMRGQIQIVKTAAENNTITRDKTGALLEGAVFEIYNTRLEVVDRITTDSRGLAVSKELPIGVYGIKEIAAPKYYFTDGTVFYAELKVDGDLVRFEVKNKPKDISVTIEKRGNVQAMPGDVIFYTLDNISNTSNIPLEEFYVHDLLPTDAVRLNQLSTGTWSEKGKFDVLYRTNKKDAYRTLASNLSTTTDNQLECGREALGLAANEYVTDIKLQFAEVGEGFHSVTSPIVTVTVLADLPDGYRFTNRADVGGRTEDEWVYAKDAWTTCIFAPPRGCLPKTGFGG